MSKERARRRAEREREQAIKAAARAAEQERRRRREARRRAATGWVPRPHWRPGVLAARRRREVAATIGILVVLNVVLWVVRDDAAARVLGIMVSLLVAPVVHVMLFGRRR
jgi:Flp pilus assembly protein TadB